jgi:hypothetical protein
LTARGGSPSSLRVQVRTAKADAYSVRNSFSTRLRSLGGWIAAVLSALLILFIASNFYEYGTAKISEMAKADLNLSGSGWVVERTYGPSDTIVELKRPRLHLP